MIPTRSFIACWSSWWRVYGFSAGPPSWTAPGCSSSALKGRSASASAASTSRSSGTGRAAVAAAYSAAYSPARRPKTSRSDRELPPSRLEPCIPPATSPAANSPGTPLAAAVSGSTSTPPIT